MPVILDSAEDHVIMDARPKVSMIIGDMLQTLTGTTITINCTAKGLPTPVLSWTRDGQFVISDDRFAIEEEASTTSGIKTVSLTIANAQALHSATYICTASNIGGYVMKASVLHIVG